jgi:hypothetical protein
VVGQADTADTPGFLEIVGKPGILIAPGNAGAHGDEDYFRIVRCDGVKIDFDFSIGGGVVSGEVYSEGEVGVGHGESVVMMMVLCIILYIFINLIKY